MRFSICQRSVVGGRRINQDRVGQWSTPDALLMACADGLGGHANGEVAAELAIDLLARAFALEARTKLAHPERFLPRATAAAHAAILRAAQERGMKEVPRTVLVSCLVQDGYAHWAHTGDSRLYLFRRGRLHARTRDHTLVQQLVDSGRIREEAVASHPERNRLLQCLGGPQAPQVDAARERLEKDDIVLLCSDGLWGPLTPRQMLNALLTRPLEQAVDLLVELAEERAGRECDNTSVVAMTWGEERVADDGPRTVPFDELPAEAQERAGADAEFLRMSDEDVEKAIADIKAALAKSAQQR